MSKIEIYAQKSTRKEYDKRRGKKSHSGFIFILAMAWIIFALTTYSYITYLKNKIKSYEVSVSNFETKLDESKAYTKKIEDALNSSTELINQMSDKMTQLEEQNNHLEEQLNSLQEQVNKTTVKPSVKITRNTDLSVRTVMTADRMNYIIDQWSRRQDEESGFVGHGQAFIDASKLTGLDPVYILAISANESGFGTSRIAKEKNNFMGIGAYDSSPYESSHNMGDCIDQGIINGAVWIASNYYDEGKTSLHDMIYGGKLYSSSKEKWINDILWIWNKSYTL